MDDFELLRTYGSRKTEDAFRSLTARYINLVYSAAVRQTGSAETAKDVTQAVFLVLAKKAGTLSRNTGSDRWPHETKELKTNELNFTVLSEALAFFASLREADLQL